MVWFRYLSNKEVLGTTTPNENYSYPLLKRVIPKFTPKDTVPDKTWLFVDVTDLNIDKYYDSDLQLQTDDASYVVVYEDPFTDDYFVPVKTVIHEDILYFETAEEHPAGIEIEKQYAVYYKTKGLRKIVEVDNGGRKDYQIYNLPVWVDNQLATIPIDAPYSDSVFAVSDPVATYSISRGRLPEGITLNPTTGAVTGTTTYVGRYFFTIRATSIHGYIEADFSDDIATNPVTPPTTIPNFYFNKNYYHSFAIQSTRPTVYYISSGSLPDGVSLDRNTGIATGIVSLDKPYYSNVQYNFTLAVEDQYGTSYTQYTGYVYHAADWKYKNPYIWFRYSDVLQFNAEYARESADLDEDYLDYVRASGYPQVKYKIEKYNIIGNGIYTSQNNVFYDKNISAAILELNLNSKGSINQTKYSQLMESANIIETDSSGGFYLAGNFTSTDTIKYSSAESRKIVYINSSGFLSNWNLTKNSQSYYAVGLLSSVKLVGSNVYMTTGNVGFYENASNSVINYQFGIASKQSGQILDLNLHTKNDQLPGKFTDSLVIGSNIYISGEFTSVNLPASSYINYDTQQHTSLPPYPIAASSNIYVVHRDSLGGIYLGGTFTSINGETRNRVAYINSLGKLDNLNINVNGAVYAITTVGSNIYIGGNFTAVNSQNAGNIGVVTRFGQTLNLGLNTNGTVRSLEAVGSNIYIAGAFTQIITANPVNAGTSYSRARFGVAAINTSGSLLSWRLGLTSNSGPNIFVLRHSENVIYIGGKFTDVSYPISSLYKINKNGTISDPIVEVSNDVYAVTNDATGGYYVGGNFAYVDGEIRKGIAYVNSNGSLTSWNPDISGTIYDIALNGDNVYVAGNFTTSQIPGTRYLTAFDINGEQLEWNPTVNGNVYSIKIINNIVYAGGNFTSVDNFPRFGLVAINSLGVVQETWNPSTNGQVRTLYVDGENIYVGGDFTLINDNARLQIALVNTSANVLSWDPGSKGNVYTIAKYANVIYVGGDFALSGGNVKSSAYKYNTSGYLVANNIGIVPNIFSLEQDAAGGFYIGGNFTSVGGETRNRAAYINSSGQLTSWDPNINGPVYSMRVYGDNIYIGGSFTSVGNNARYSLAAVNTVGNLLGWNPQTDGTVYNIFNIGNNIYIGGNYRTLGGLRSRYLKIAGNGSSNTTSYAISQPIRTIVRDVTGGIYIGGDFTSIGDQVRNRIAYLNSLGFLTDWSPNVNGNVHSIAVLGSNIYFGGAFTSVNGNERNYAAAVNNSGNLLAWHPNSNGNIYAIAIAANSQVWIGGQFQVIKSSLRDNNLAVLDTLNATRLASGYVCDGPVHAISVSGVNIYVGGSFTSIAGYPRRRLAAFNTSGTLSTSWVPNANGNVYAVTAFGTDIFVGGSFTNIWTPTQGFVTKQRVAALSQTGTVYTTFNADANSNVFTIRVYGANAYLGGQFTTIRGNARNYLAAVTGSTVLSWNPSVDGNVYAIVAYQDGATPSFHVGGEFTNSTDRLRNSLGSVDTAGNILTFNPNVISNSTTNTVGTVYAITSSGSNIYVGGEFTLVNGNARNRLAALNASANVLSWNPNASGTVRSISVAGTNAYVGGDFLKVGNIDRTYAAVVNVSTTNTILGWNITIDAPVRQIVFNNEINDAAATPYIYLAGDFTTVENEKRMYSAKVNTLEGLASWNPSTNGNVFALSIYGDNVMIAGPFDDSADTEKPYIFAVDDLENPVSWNPIVNGTVRKIAITGEGATPNIYIGGDFTTVNGNNQKYVAGLNVTNGLLSWSPNINNSVYDIEIFGDNIYFGGSFNFLHKKVVQNFSAINTEGSLTDFEINADSTIRDIRFIGSNIYIGGEFSLINGTTRNYLAAVNTAETLLSWNPNPNGNVHTIATVGSNIYFGGEFTQVSGSATRAYIAGETAADENILLYNNNLSINGPVYAIASGENNIFVGGGFTDYNIYNRSNLMAINTSGKVLPWNPNVNAIVKTMTSIGSNIYIAGNFTKVNNVDAKGLVAVNTSGSVLSWNPYRALFLGNVYSMIEHNNTILVGGWLTISNYLDRDYFTVVNDNSDLLVYSDYRSFGGSSQIRTFIKDENNGFYLGGDFTSFKSPRSAYVSVDSLGNATGFKFQNRVRFENGRGVINALKVDSTGGFYIAGAFDFVGSGISNADVNDVSRKNIAYINSSGYLTNFNVSVSGDIENGQILTLDILGDNIYFGGTFTSVNGIQRNYLAAVNSSGNLLNWNPSASANVWSMKVSGNNIYVGGDFITINGNSRNRLAAVNADGTIITGWAPNVNGSVRTIGILGTNIYFGGTFTQVNGNTRNRLAAVNADGTIITGWDPNASFDVYTLEIAGSNIYVGGAFGTLNPNQTGVVNRNRLAVINTNGNLQTTWNPSANGVVRTIKVNQTNVYVGGDFTIINGTTRNKSAAIGTNNTLLTWNLNLNSGTSSNVFAIDIDNSGLSTKIYFAGRSNIYENEILRNKLAYMNSSGFITDWNPNVNGNIFAMELLGSNIYIGGAFTSVNGITRRSVAALSTVDINATGNLLSWNPGVSYYNSITATHELGAVTSMVISGANIYIGGLFNSIAQSSRTSFGAVTTSGTVLSLGTGILSNISNQEIYTLAIADQTLYIGGNFKITSNTTNQYSMITTSNGNVSYSNFNAKIYAAVADSSGGFYVGGEFTSIGGQTRSNLAYINSIGLIGSWNPTSDSIVRSMLIKGDNIYIGGEFTSVNGNPRNYLAAVNTNGNIIGWSPSASSQVLAMASIGDNIYFGGVFRLVNGNIRAGLAAADTAGTLLSWAPNIADDLNKEELLYDGGINAITISGSNIYVAGSFGFVSGQRRNNIAAINTSGTLLSWNPNANGNVTSIICIGSNIYFGGSFTFVGENTRNRLAAVNSSGNLLNWNPNVIGEVESMTVFGSNIYVAGNFLKISNEKRYYVAGISNQGLGELLDYNIPYVDDKISFIYASDQKILISGEFRSIDANLKESFAAINVSNNQVLPLNFKFKANNISVAVNYLLKETFDLKQGTIKSIAVDGDNIYIGGYFNYINDVRRERLVAINTSGSILEFSPRAYIQELDNEHPYSEVSDIHISGENIYIGGGFTAINDDLAIGSAVVFSKSGELLNWYPKIRGGVTKIKKYGSNVYISGSLSLPKYSMENMALFDLNGKLLDSKYTPRADIQYYTAVKDFYSYISKLKKLNNSIYISMNYTDNGLEHPLLRPLLMEYDEFGRLHNFNIPKQSYQTVAETSDDVYAKTGYINDIGIINDKIYAVGKFETDTLPVGLQLNSTTGEISGIHESKYYGKVVKEDTSIAALSSKYFTFDFSWTIGASLNTRTTIISPITSNTIGEIGSYPDEGGGVFFDFSNYLYWKRVETGVTAAQDFESILFDKTNFDIAHPGATQVTFRVKAAWSAFDGAVIRPDFDSVTVNVSGYAGTVTLGSKDVRFGYIDWLINSPVPQTYENFSSYSKLVSTIDHNEYDDYADPGDTFIDVTLDFVNGKVIYTTAYEAHKMIVSVENELGYAHKSLEM